MKIISNKRHDQLTSYATSVERLTNNLVNKDKEIQELKAKIASKPQSRKDKEVSYEHVYTDNAGNKYFTCPIESLSNERRIYFQSILNQMAVGIEVGELEKLCIQGIEHATKGEKELVIKNYSNILTRTSHVGTPTLLYQGALYCIFMEGEPWEYSQHWVEKKQDLFTNDKDLRFFVLGHVLNITVNLSNISVEDLIQWEVSESEKKNQA